MAWGANQGRTLRVALNPGDVWRLATAGYKEAHFATFPVALVERPLLASCPERVCLACGKPWVRERAGRRSRRDEKPGDALPGAALRLVMPGGLGELRPACDCRAGYRPGVVLDPFMGAGTVAVAAERHGREWVGIELNPAYARLAEERIVKERGKITAGRDSTGVAVRPTAGIGVRRPYDPRAA